MMARSFAVLLLLLGSTWLALSQDLSESDRKRDPRDLPIESDVVENVQVELAEVRILVTDRRGNPITDLKPAEVRILEGGVSQKLAYLDNIGTTRFAGNADEGPPPAAVYTQTGEMIDASSRENVMPARAMRRVILAFDIVNSKLNIREAWRAAAEEWVRTKMQPDDLVGVVVLRSYPQWLVDFTSDRMNVLNTLKAISLEQGIQDRDRSRDVARLVEDIHSLCTDLGRPSDKVQRRDGTTGSNAPSRDVQSCAYNLTQAQVAQWDAEAKETMGTMRGLTGQLAAIPGRKLVVLFSEGWVTDAGTTGSQAMVSVFGVGRIDMSGVVWSLDHNAFHEMTRLHETAKAANVSFFTIDTTQGYDRGFGSNLERGQVLSQNNAGVNVFSEMSWATRTAMNVLAKETGGRSYYGTKDLEGKIAAATDSFFGYYLIGYYRANPRARAGKVKVQIDRRKIDVSYPDKPTLWPHRAARVRLDLSVGQPVLDATGGSQVLPLKFTMNLADIPLRRGSGGRGAQLGVYVQAVRPDGTVAAERLDVATIVLDRQGGRARESQSYEHTTELILPEGPYRIRARISDDRQKILGERVLDLTVKAGAVVAGFEPAPANAD